MNRAEEFAVKLERIGHFLTESDLDGVALSRGDNFAWLGCGADNLVNNAAETGVATLLARRDGVTLITSNIEAERLQTEELDGLRLAGTEVFPWHEPAARHAILGRVTAGGKFAVDDGSAGLPALPPEFNRLRYTLTDAEVERYRALGRDAADAMEAAAGAVESGMTEADAAALVAAQNRRRGVLPVVLLVAADDRIARWRHPLVKRAEVRRVAMLVICGRRHGLIAAVTRLVHFGELSADLAARHRAVCAVDAAMIAATVPGRTAADVFAAGRCAYAENGFPDEWRLHHQGGATGYQAREYIANPSCTEVVQAAQAFAWNPSIRGTKSEDTILAGPDGPEVLTPPSADWPVLKMEQDGAAVERADILVL